MNARSTPSQNILLKAHGKEDIEDTEFETGKVVRMTLAYYNQTTAIDFR